MKVPLPATSPVRKGRHLSPFVFTLFAFVLFVAILYGHDYFQSSITTVVNLDDHIHLPPSEEPLTVNSHKLEESMATPFAVGKGEEGCDIFSGKWVKDEKNMPMYEESECPYLQPQVTCQAHGRPDIDYQFWRWQPNSCHLPKFNASLMLESLRDKRMLFVGDSLNRGQFLSMVCLLHSLASEEGKSMNFSMHSLSVFHLKDYNATIEFYWAPLLLESNSDDTSKGKVPMRIVRKDSMNAHGHHWEGADIVVFNSYIWWTSGNTVAVLKGSFEDEEQEIEKVKTEEAYRMGMKSLVEWVESNMDPNKTRVFFTSMSPSHTKSIRWGGEPEGNCYNQTTIIEDPNYWGETRKSMMEVLREELTKSKVPISFINITQLSAYRKDAHSQIYKKLWSPVTPEQKANPTSYADCIHWCLPGLQDTWNELLFAKLFYP